MKALPSQQGRGHLSVRQNLPMPACAHVHPSRARCHYHCAGTSSSKPSVQEQVAFGVALGVAGVMVVGSLASACVSQLRVLASALSRDSSCSASMADAAPALASAPVRAPEAAVEAALSCCSCLSTEALRQLLSAEAAVASEQAQAAPAAVVLPQAHAPDDDESFLAEARQDPEWCKEEAAFERAVAREQRRLEIVREVRRLEAVTLGLRKQYITERDANRACAALARAIFV
jgi:hypothetical protein